MKNSKHCKWEQHTAICSWQDLECWKQFAFERKTNFPNFCFIFASESSLWKRELPVVGRDNQASRAAAAWSEVSFGSQIKIKKLSLRQNCAFISLLLKVSDRKGGVGEYDLQFNFSVMSSCYYTDFIMAGLPGTDCRCNWFTKQFSVLFSCFK